MYLRDALHAYIVSLHQHEKREDKEELKHSREGWRRANFFIPPLPPSLNFPVFSLPTRPSTSFLSPCSTPNAKEYVISCKPPFHPALFPSSVPFRCVFFCQVLIAEDTNAATVRRECDFQGNQHFPHQLQIFRPIRLGH